MMKKATIADYITFEDKVILFVDYVLSGKTRFNFSEDKTVSYTKTIDGEKQVLSTGLTYNLFLDIVDSLSKIDYNDATTFGNLSRYYLDKFLEIQKRVDDYSRLIFNPVDTLDGGKREFDIIDQYMYIDMMPETLFTCLKAFGKSAQESAYARIFKTNKSIYSASSNFEKCACFDDDEEEIRKAKYSFFDGDISEELKEDLINFIKNIGAPVSHRVFNKALNRYRSGDLDIYYKNIEYHK